MAGPSACSGWTACVEDCVILYAAVSAASNLNVAARAALRNKATKKTLASTYYCNLHHRRRRASASSRDSDLSGRVGYLWLVAGCCWLAAAGCRTVASLGLCLGPAAARPGLFCATETLILPPWKHYWRLQVAGGANSLDLQAVRLGNSVIHMGPRSARVVRAPACTL